MTRTAVLLLVAAASLSGGCASLSNPVADGVPVRRVPAEVLGRGRSELRTVPLNLLRQREPDSYRLDKGDVLAVVAEGVLGQPNVPAPVHLPDRTTATPAIGYPVPVNEDGTITIPLLPPISVRGKTLAETEQLLTDFVTGRAPGSKRLVAPEAARVSVQILQKRAYEVLVVREDSSQTSVVGTGGGLGGGNIVGTDKRATGVTLRMPAYENDVLRAFNATGGLPGLGSEDEVVVIRGRYDPADPFKNATRIPLRAYPDQPVAINEDDVILWDGDILFVRARETDVYYTAGVIGSGQFAMPRDTDLRVTQAIARVRGSLISGAFNQTGFQGGAVSAGLGTPSPSLVIVLRKLPGNQQIPIRVDLDRAFRDLREDIIVRPGDMIVMQEKPGQAILRYLTQSLRLTTVGNTIQAPGLNQVITGNNP